MGWLNIFRKKDTVVPSSFVLEYKSLFRERIPKRIPISELIFTVLDTETTGLNSKTDEIISYGAIKVQGYSIKVNSVQEFYLKPKNRDKTAVKIHGVVKNEGFLSQEDFAKSLLNDIGRSILVAHHAGFDVHMLEKVLRGFGLKKILNPVIDTLDLAIRLEVGLNHNPRLINRMDYSLDRLCGRYGIALDDRHTASGDAFLTAQLLLKLLKSAERSGIKTYGDLMRG
jgi:DNA polymerase-3 subunit epsilon